VVSAHEQDALKAFAGRRLVVDDQGAELPHAMATSSGITIRTRVPGPSVRAWISKLARPPYSSSSRERQEETPVPVPFRAVEWPSPTPSPSTKIKIPFGALPRI